MTERRRQVFNAIKEFVYELSNLYQNDKQIGLYKRLLDAMTDTDDKYITKHINAFSVFFSNYRDEVLSMAEFPREACIIYTPGRIYIDVNKCIHKGTGEVKTAIYDHLLTIFALVNPKDNDVLSKLESINPIKEVVVPTGTKEEQFVSNIMGKVEKTLETTGTTDNPMSAITSLLASGIMNDMTDGFKKGIESGEFDTKKLIGTMKNAMNVMYDQIEKQTQAEEEETKRLEEIRSLHKKR